MNPRTAFRVCAALTLLSALVSVGFSLAALFAVGHADLSAQYAASRSLALPLGVAVAIGMRCRQALGVLALVMTAVQLMDGVIGILAHDPAKTYGPFVLALATAGAAFALRRAARELDLPV